ncbi:MAG: Mov34/MPN/PAD-1 family protein [Planctomycetota bacterium]
MLKSSYHYRLDLFRDRDEELLGQSSIPLSSLSPALECLQFEAIRGERLPPRLGACPPSVIEPCWSHEQGRPYLDGMRLAILEPQCAEEGSSARSIAESEIPTTYFRELARAAGSELLAEGKLEKGELYRFRISAFYCGDRTGEPAEPPALATGSAGGLEVLPMEWELPIRTHPIDGLLARASLEGEEDSGALPLFIPGRVLDEVEALKVEADGVETGGILLGNMLRDGDRSELFVEVTAQIHATDAPADATRLSFTPETWAAVDDAIALRRKGEIRVGWWHSHPAKSWCSGCDPARWPHCPLAQAFFSTADRHLHHTVFPAAFTVALIVGDEPTESLTWRTFHALFGWQEGELRRRSFHRLEDRRNKSLANT